MTADELEYSSRSVNVDMMCATAGTCAMYCIKKGCDTAVHVAPIMKDGVVGSAETVAAHLSYMKAAGTAC